MKPSTLILAVCMQGFALAASIYPSHAFDLSGAWATQPEVCDKVFEKGKTISLRKNASVYGGGFVVENGVIRGGMMTCRIRTTKKAGAVTHLLAVCSSDILTGTLQLSYKTVNDNQIIRLFPGMEGIEVSYYRCPFKN